MTIDQDGRRLSYGGGSTSWIIIIARDELQLGLASYATQSCVEKEVIALGTITSMTLIRWHVATLSQITPASRNGGDCFYPLIAIDTITAK